MNASHTAPAAGEPWPFLAREEELDLLGSAVTAGIEAPQTPSGAVVVAAAGVGKTRLLAHARARAQRQGIATHTVIGTRAGAQTPFAALAHLAPEDRTEPADPATLYRRYSEALRGSGERPVLVVDDAHLLDAGSAALVLNLAVTGTATVLAGVRHGEPCPDPITALWKDGLALRIDLQNLSREETETLIRQVFDDEVDGRTARLLAETTRGNPLYTRELIRGTLASGALRLAGRTWSWDGRVALAPQLSDAIRARLSGLDAAERDGLAAVALGEPLALRVAESMIETEVLSRLESADLVHAGSGECRLVHPLYGDVALEQLGTLAVRRLMRTLADTVEQHGGGSEEEVMRVATWRLDGGSDVTAASLERAAILANRAFDHSLANRLATAAIERGAGAEAKVALAQALNGSRRFAEAEALLADAEPDILLAVHAELHRAYLDRRYVALYQGLGRREATAAMLDRFVDAHADATPAHRASAGRIATAYRSNLLLDTGQFRATVAELTGLLADPGTEPHALLVALENAAEATAYLGNTDTARGLHARLSELAATGHPEVARAAATAALQEALCQLLEGRVHEVLPIMRGFYQQIVSSADDITRGLAALSLGSAELLQGTVASARRCLADAVSAMRAAQVGDALPWALAVSAQAEALAGDGTAARRSFTEASAGRLGRPVARCEPDFVLAEAMVKMAGGDLTGAARTCIEGAAALPEMALHAARLLHTAARLGSPPRPLAGQLATIADEVECPLPRLQADHVAALAADDGAALESAADHFDALGMELIAAEAAAQASAVHARNGARSSAARSRARSAELAQQCEGADTPALRVPTEPARLSRREREIASLAAQGLSNAQIAARLTLSSRTVESHLYQAFAKLDVARREDLADALERQ